MKREEEGLATSPFERITADMPVGRCGQLANSRTRIGGVRLATINCQRRRAPCQIVPLESSTTKPSPVLTREVVSHICTCQTAV